MDKISKALAKLNQPEKKVVVDILKKIENNNVIGLDLKKLKGYANIYRVRSGKLRIIYRIDNQDKIFLVSIERRNDNTYKF